MTTRTPDSSDDCPVLLPRPGVAQGGPRHAELGVQRRRGQQTAQVGVGKEEWRDLSRATLFDQKNYLKIRRYNSLIKFDFLLVPLLHLYLDFLDSFQSNLSF